MSHPENLMPSFGSGVHKASQPNMFSASSDRQQQFSFQLSFPNLHVPTFGVPAFESRTPLLADAVKAGETRVGSSSPSPFASATDQMASQRQDFPTRSRVHQKKDCDRQLLMRYSSVKPAKGVTKEVSKIQIHEIQTAPLFSAKVQDVLEDDIEVASELELTSGQVFPQYSMLGNKIGTFNTAAGAFEEVNGNDPDNLVFLNMNEPFSTFICGSQGGGKSHTLSCMLEGGLLRPNPTGQIKSQAAALVFHYDQFSSHSTSQICEAAYLCSKGVPVRVLVSPTNYHSMAEVYGNLPGLAPNMPKPVVLPFYLKEDHLHIENMKKLMSCAGGEAALPLYLERVFSILKDMAMEAGSTRVGFDYQSFRRQLDIEDFSKDQKGPLKQRLLLLDDFLTRYKRLRLQKAAKKYLPTAWDFEPGSLTIIDLSCPFVSPEDACSLFTVALSIFLESRGSGAAKMIALDEAHKFLNDSPDALQFTNDLTSIIAQQRHLGVRVIIATQEPTLSPRLLELSNVSIVHRFKSPQWFEALKKHLAGPDQTSGRAAHSKIFEEIVKLNTGQALVFAPTAMVDVSEGNEHDQQTGSSLDKIKQQGMGILKVAIRQRITVDGGKSVTATPTN